jgi:hypothetical protein
MLGLPARFLLVGTCCSAFLAAQSHAHVGGVHSLSASSIIGGRPFPVPPGISGASALRGSPSGIIGINPGALRSHGFYNRGFEGRYRGAPPVGYLWAPYYYPFLDYDAGYGPGPDYGDIGPDPNVQGAIVGQNMLGEQVQRLTGEVDQLRASQQAQGAPPLPAEPQQAQAPSTPPITVVLHSGQQIQVQSYAVMGSTLWDFSTQPARKFPISNIDINASTKATEANGGEFPSLTGQ